jgi:hypothetical protein
MGQEDREEEVAIMGHPFHGIIGPAPDQQGIAVPLATRAVGRRSFFVHSLSALAGLGAWLLTRSASAQTPFDGGRGMGFPEGGALQGGYGGGLNSAPGGGTVTTFALGEEGGYYPPPRRRRPRWGGGSVTTFALGEEGGYYPPPRVTTYALGEEGGGYYYRRW